MSEKNNNFKILIISGLAMVVFAAIVLMGWAVIAQMSDVIRTTQTTTVDSITIPATNSSVTVGLELVTDITGCLNLTDGASFPDSYFTVYSGTRTTNGGLTINYPLSDQDTWIGSDINCSVTNKQSNSGSNAGETFLIALAIFGTFAGILVLAVMGKAVIGMFKKV